jgi:haloacetate dehalogenase
MAEDLLRVVDLVYAGEATPRQFVVVAHDRGARATHRLALDHPDRLLGVALLDIVPLTEMWKAMRWSNWRRREVLSSPHWFFLTWPTAEWLISRSPETFITTISACSPRHLRTGLRHHYSERRLRYRLQG